MSFNQTKAPFDSGEVWGEPGKPKSWRIIKNRTVDRTGEWITYFVIGYPYEVSEPISDWNKWFVETKPWSISGAVDDYIRRCHEQMP